MSDLIALSKEVFVAPICLKASDAQYSAARALLTREELARADRYVTTELSRRFVMCRSHLRQFLGRALEQDPAKVAFEYEKWGKPWVSSPLGNVHFNVSHSGDFALVAIANQPLGVDIEISNPRIQLRAIASQIVSPLEQTTWESMSAQQQNESTLPLWVCKEALLKAIGLGIADGLKAISFPIPLPKECRFEPRFIDPALQMYLDEDGSCKRTHWVDAQSWRLEMLDVFPKEVGAISAICLPQQIKRVRISSC